MRRPGGELATRPLHFFWIADCSASMGLDGKIQALNTAIREALPHMRDVQEENANATIMLRTLRFSSGARWIGTDSVPLSQFHWQDLAADDLPRTAQFAAEFRSRLAREGAKSGDVQISLLWNNYNDLDLHVNCPSGERIYFGHRQSACGGELDVDMNVSPTSIEPVENVVWPAGAAPDGQYAVFVHEFKNHGSRTRPGCQDPTPFRVAVSQSGFVEEVSGTISHGEGPQLVHTFQMPHAAGKGVAGGNTDLGAALHELAKELHSPPMPMRALPPVIVLISDGQPTDDFEAGLQELLALPWGKRSVRVAIGIGQDVDEEVLRKFMGNPELAPLKANSPEALARMIRWVSTAITQTASAPQTRLGASGATPYIPQPEPVPDTMDVW